MGTKLEKKKAGCFYGGVTLGEGEGGRMVVWFMLFSRFDSVLILSPKTTF